MKKRILVVHWSLVLSKSKKTKNKKKSHAERQCALTGLRSCRIIIIIKKIPFLCPSNASKYSETVRLHISLEEKVLQFQETGFCLFVLFNKYISVSSGLALLSGNWPNFLFFFFFCLELYCHKQRHWHHKVKKKKKKYRWLILFHWNFASARFVSLCCHVIWRSARLTVQWTKTTKTCKFPKGRAKTVEDNKLL